MLLFCLQNLLMIINPLEKNCLTTASKFDLILNTSMFLLIFFEGVRSASACSFLFVCVLPSKEAADQMTLRSFRCFLASKCLVYNNFLFYTLLISSYLVNKN